ncbi:hypothetical protein ACMDCT_13965 [Halomonadaceae bacterium KBTZ08]
MSLLNDALRDLEKRQSNDGNHKETIPAGLSAASGQSGPRWRLVLGGAALLLAVAAGGGIWWLGSGGSQPAKSTVASMEPEPVPVVRPVIRDPGEGEPKATAGSAEPRPSENPERGTNSGPEETEASVAPVVQVPEADNTQGTAVATDDASAEADPEPEPQPEAAGASEAVQAPEPVGETAPVAASETDAGSAAAKPNVRELTPAEKDRRLASKLEALLADGRLAEAEERLSERLEQGAEAPRARAVMARNALARGAPSRALAWLPEQAVAMNPKLRLLRARVALAQEGKASALEWLVSDPPGPGSMPSYHSMMAALYQQTGDHQAAAEQWAALIETDDGNARWWAGLGIAMESRGRDQKARAAYARALSLPDLAPQLRRYIEQRLAEKQG